MKVFVGGTECVVALVTPVVAPRTKLFVAREVPASIEARVVAVDAVAAALTGCAAEPAAPEGTRLAQGRVLVTHYATACVTRPLLVAELTDLVGARVDVTDTGAVVLQRVDLVYQSRRYINGV